MANRARKWLEALGRRRRSRGFGIHSPLAYRLVREAVRPDPRYGWYGYHDIERALRQSEHGRRQSEMRFRARLLLRLCAVLHPALVWLGPNPHPALAAAVRSAGVRLSAGPVPPSGCMAVGADCPGLLTVAGSSLLSFEPSAQLVEAIRNAMPEGLLLHGPGVLLAVARERMPLVEHTVNFARS